MTTDAQKIRDNVLINNIISALQTDGAQHKQWYLEELLKLLTNDVAFADIKEREQWLPGLVP